ncbi:MAG: hypothetical protein ABIP95_15140, partial [Pelobium sp.]
MNQAKFTGPNESKALKLMSFNFSRSAIGFRHFLLALCCLFCFSALKAQNRQPRTPTPNDDLVSFQVNDDQSATLRLYAPNAKSVE